MRKFLGALIRRERLRRNFSQEGLCRGVCAVSYLSKIEQGKVEAGEDILLPLLRRLGVDYETDPAFLARAEEAVYAQRLAELRETNERLATDIANSDDPELIEEIARDELGMVEQGEKIIRFNY